MRAGDVGTGREELGRGGSGREGLGRGGSGREKMSSEGPCRKEPGRVGMGREEPDRGPACREIADPGEAAADERHKKKREREREILYWLLQVPSLGPVTIGKMRRYAGDITALYNIEGTQWRELGLLKEGQASCWDQAKKNIRKIMEEYHSLDDRGIRFITILDEDYPDRLKVLADAPIGLYVKGRLPKEERPTLAIIGSRNATRYGLEVARCFGRELAREGVQIVSGLAAGIDGAGHQGALEGRGRTFGVLGCGINICYPRENYLLYEKMLAEGGILSEYPLGEPPQAKNFPIRNRIISGLSDGILVVEAREKSGSLITVGSGLEQGKGIFAIPGRITDPGSAGCDRLIQEGAALVSSPGDILEELGVKCEKKLTIREKNEKGLAKREKMVYSFIDLQPKHLDEIVSQSGLPLSECMMILLDLELKGFVVRTGGNHYEKKL